MKILIVIDTLGSGGAQKLKVKLAKGLKKKGYEVEFFIYDSCLLYTSDAADD